VQKATAEGKKQGVGTPDAGVGEEVSQLLGRGSERRSVFFQKKGVSYLRGQLLRYSGDGTCREYGRGKPGGRRGARGKNDF